MESHSSLSPIAQEQLTSKINHGQQCIGDGLPTGPYHGARYKTSADEEMRQISALTMQENERMESVMHQLYHPSSPFLKSSVHSNAADMVSTRNTDEVRAELAQLQQLINGVFQKHGQQVPVHDQITIDTTSSEHSTKPKPVPCTPARVDRKPQSCSHVGGRKSIREIADELCEKIQQLRTNSSKWDVFCARVASYKAAIHYGRQINVIQRNIQDARSYHPSVRHPHLQAKILDRRNKYLSVYQESKRIHDDRLARIQAALLTKSRKHPANTKLVLLQYKWLFLGSLASRIYIMQTVIRTNHTEFLEFTRRSAAARRIQSAWRHHRYNVMQRRKVWALKVIGRAMAKFIAHIRLLRKHSAADTIRVFFKEIHHVGKLLKIIKKYRYSVISAQRLVRQKLLVRRAQLSLLECQFDSVYLSMAAGSIHNLAAADPPSTPTASSKPKNKRSGKKKRDDSSKDTIKKSDVLPTIDPVVRNKLLHESYIERRKLFIKQLIKYSNALDEYQVEYNSNNGDSAAVDPAKRPVFKVLLPKPDMIDLVNKALS